MKVLFVGDTHGNARWWDRVVSPLTAELGVDVVIQVGDFGFWPGAGGAAFLAAVARTGVPVYFLDGNHEHHDLLDVAVRDARQRNGVVTLTSPVQLDDNLWFLPRGARFRLGDVTFCAVGGAHSIDRAFRTPGESWFAAETLSDADIETACEGGPADVLLCHDAPAGWAIPGLLSPESMVLDARLELPAAHEHRERLRKVFTSVQPAVVIHGHYHSRYSVVVSEQWGDVVVDGLDCDGTDGAFCVMECDGEPELFDVSLS